ncbi:outer membrane lipoprotein-sorting protein [Patescibacteria group bacterium]|nr:outer membrane lipoprotein-sorting protein [Patescibacteria group bacterium]
MNQELENYIKESKNSGFSDEQIKQELRKAGWKEEDINQAFSREPILNKSSIQELTINTNKKNESKTLGMIALVVIIFLIIGGGVFYYIKLKPSENKEVQKNQDNNSVLSEEETKKQEEEKEELKDAKSVLIDSLSKLNNLTDFRCKVERTNISINYDGEEKQEKVEDMEIWIGDKMARTDSFNFIAPQMNQKIIYRDNYFYRNFDPINDNWNRIDSGSKLEGTIFQYVIRALEENPVLLGSESVNGKSTFIIKYEEFGGLYGDNVKIWIEKETGIPLKIEDTNVFYYRIKEDLDSSDKDIFIIYEISYEPINDSIFEIIGNIESFD